MNLLWILFMLLFARSSYAADRLMVPMTLVNDTEALCLDGSAPMYHFDKGSGSGARNWVLTFEGGGWCNDLKSCLQRSKDRHGSTTLMNKYAIFSGILSNDPTKNPDFYNWNRVKLRYCDGGSFAGDAIYENGTTKLYFKGQKIWDAIIRDLLPKGLNNADKGLLAGSSAGGLSTFFHCDNFASVLPKIATVKCLSDAGFFVDIKDILSNDTARVFYENLMDIQGIEKNLNKKCTSSLPNPKQCFFPQYVLPYINTPYFILNVAYDTYQIRHHLVPPNTDLHGKWNHCKQDPTTCTPDQLKILQGLRDEMVKALEPFGKSSKGGMFVTSCFGHGQSELQGTWFAPGAPKMNNKQIATVVGDWYFERGVAMEVGLPYPSDTDCHNEVL